MKFIPYVLTWSQTSSRRYLEIMRLGKKQQQQYKCLNFKRWEKINQTETFTKKNLIKKSKLRNTQ